MSVSPIIDFKNLYEFESVSTDRKISSFKTELDTGQSLPIVVKISNHQHELLPNVYNLSFGPLDKKGDIDDRVELTHRDFSKVFSTILFLAISYLKNNPGHYLGVDGSDNTRAYFYYRTLQRNYKILDKHFHIYGIKYFVRITRFGKKQYDNPFDFEDIMPVPTKIGKGDPVSQDNMYNYFIFTLKHATDESK